MEKLKLHYAPIDLKNNIYTIEFEYIDKVIDFLDQIYPENIDDIVYLISHKDEIYITESLDYLFHILENIHICCFDYTDDEFDIFLQEYPSYQEAYKVALMMKENSKLCYSSETKKSPYWTNK
jgi:hypothetical protein